MSMAAYQYTTFSFLFLLLLVQIATKSQFGVPLSKLVPPGVLKVPTVLEKCFACIEKHGKQA